MKLEKNMYVRTKGGFIDKIISFKSTISNDYVELEDEYYANKKNILKASHNIIDLIEEHDILKIEEQKGVYTICEVEAFREPYTNYYFLGVRLDNTLVARKLYELNIKSIVTKEQFESMEYRIGE